MNRLVTKAILLCLGAVLLVPAGVPALADHYRVYELRQSGEILPLEVILERAKRIQPGELLEAELEEEDGQLVYEVEMYGADKRYHELYFDARTGDLLKNEREGDDAHPAGGG